MRRRLISTTRPSLTISLFSEPSIAPRAPSSFAFSMLAHAVVAGMVYLAFTRVPRIDDRNLLAQYDVRQLDLHPLDQKFPEYQAESKRQIPYPSLDPELKAGILHPGLKDAMRRFLGSAAGRQTLIQPQLHTHLSFAEQVPVPNIIIWTPVQMPRKKIVAPPPAPDTSSYVTPSLELPNQEIKLSNLAVTSTDISPRSEAVPASTTSPIETSTVKPVQKPLVTVSKSEEQPTAAAVLSISNIQMEEGTVFLPPVNDIARSTAAPGNGAASDPGNPSSGGPASRNSAAGMSEADSMTADGRQLSTEHILLPRDGKFSVVVVGNSLVDDYPETADLWANRMAYTAYLHVGLKKNWILQYSLTRAAEVAAGGSVARLEAPWPYDIMRPNLLAKDVNGGALMIHGVLNQAGRLESLAIAFPTNFRYSGYVLHRLREWQFRPARQNGQSTVVEVLLIIPEEVD